MLSTKEQAKIMETLARKRISLAICVLTIL
jgi:hypothetical protein